ncbi:MAG: SLBB domain-containing protein [Sphingobacteriales bacterium]|nr:SLBB domain-containing protein [Sphingobacteriales bacterium]
MRYRIILLLIFSFLSVALKAQNISIADVQNTKVDDLTDDQIMIIYQKLQSSGISESTAYSILEQKGMPTAEVEKLKLRISKIKSGSYTGNTTKLSSKRDSISYSRVKPPSIENVFDNVLSNIYGKSFFNNPKLSFEPNIRIATPENYVLGPDDELIIILTGLNETAVKTKVAPDGFVQIPYAGLVNVSGMTIAQAKVQIRAKMLKVYPEIATGKTSLSVTLGNIRSIRVTVVGQVIQPGTYTISSLSTLFNVLYQTDGPTENGSLRSIELIRNNKVIKTVDFYDFLQKGLMDGNVRLEDQDVIHIPFYQKRVVIAGEVKNPMAYELKQQETLDQLIQYAGGFKAEAYEGMVKVFQKGKTELQVKNVNKDLFENYVPMNGDSVVVSQILDRYTNRVRIEGAVYRPGVFELTPNLSLKGLIKDADGLKNDALMNRGYINRTQPDLKKLTIPFDLDKIMSGDAPDIALQREDEVHILSTHELHQDLTLSISGLVKKPGIYPFRKGMQLPDLIAMAGGFQYNAAAHRIEVSRIIPNQSDTVANQLVETFTVNLDSNLNVTGNPIELQALDKITVPQLVNFQTLGNIGIGGEVLFPGVYALQRRDETALELIARAGGITPTGSLVNAQIYRRGLRVDADFVGKEKDRKLILLPQDSIFIPKENPFVEVVGGVNTPQLFRYHSQNFKYYLNAAGGVKQNVRLKNAFVSYPNGINSPVKHFLFFRNYPVVTKGSKIVIPQPSLDVKVRLGAGEISAVATALTALVSIIAILKK